MNELYSFIYSLAVVAAAAGIATAIAPDSGQLKKYVKYVASLCVLVMIVMPAKNVISALSEGVGETMAALESDYAAQAAETDAGSLVMAQTKANLEKTLALMLAAKLDCEETQVSVEVTLDASDEEYIKVENVNVLAPADRKTVGIEIWLAEQTGCAAGNVVIEWVSSGI